MQSFMFKIISNKINSCQQQLRKLQASIINFRKLVFLITLNAFEHLLHKFTDLLLQITRISHC